MHGGPTFYNPEVTCTAKHLADRSLLVIVGQPRRRGAQIAQPMPRPGRLKSLSRLFALPTGASASGRVDTSERRETAAAPGLDVVLLDRRELAGVPLLALVERHGQRPVEGGGDFVDVVRVHDQGTVEQECGAREAGQDQEAGILGVLRGHEFLGDQVEAVAQGRDQARTGCAVVAGERAARLGPVDVTQGHPVGLAVAADDVAGEAFGGPAQVAVLRQILAARGRDLQQNGLAAVAGIALE